MIKLPVPILSAAVFALLLSTSASAQSLPDLLVQQAVLESSQAAVSGEFEVELTILNNGSIEVDGFHVTIWLSTDSTLSSSDLFIGIMEFGDLNPFETEDEEEEYDLPSSVGAGNYWVIIEVDSLQEVLESNESNNTDALSLQIGSVTSASSTPILPCLMNVVMPPQSLEAPLPPLLGNSFTLRAQDPADSAAISANAYALFVLSRARLNPCGTAAPGLGVGQNTGEVLISLLPTDLLLTTGARPWDAVNRNADFQINLPTDPAWSGIEVYAQALIVDPGQGSVLTNGLMITLGQ